MPSKSLGLFPASLSTDPLFCLEFVEITNKIETAGGLERARAKGSGRGEKQIYSFLRPLRGHCRPQQALSRALEENYSLQKISRL